MKVVSKAYDRWYAILENEKTTLHVLLKTFDHLDFSFDVKIGKNEIKKQLQPIKHGDEIILLWLTTDGTHFRPTLRQFPGPTINRNMVTSWL